jgi:iron complex outermembrane recepter protein
MNKQTAKCIPLAEAQRSIISGMNALYKPSRCGHGALLNSAATCALVTLCVVSDPARAQAGPAASVSNATARPEITAPEEVVVTAQRRQERLSKVPISITALTAATLKTRVISHEQDLAAAVPGLIVKQGQNQNQVSFTLRGQTLDPFSGASPAVLTYLNEVPFNGGNSATSFYDFSSLQVLKGPQGTLFGRNATGGAILYTSTLPKDKYGGYLTVSGGDRNLREVQGAVDLPLVPGKLAIRLAGDYQGQDGYIHNELTGGNLGDIDDKSGRVTVVLTPTDYIKNVTVFEYSNFGGTEANGELYSYYKLGQVNNGYPLTTTLDTIYGEGLFPTVGNGPPGPGTFPGAVAGYLAYQRAHPYDVYMAYNLPHSANNDFLSNTTTVNLNDETTFKNIFGYQSSYAHTPGILSGSPFASLDLYNTSGVAIGPPGGEVFRNSSVSEEAQVTGTTLSERLKYIVGAFYNYADKEELIPVIVGGELPAPLGQVLYHTHGTDESEAVYSQATYDFSDFVHGLSFTAGARYTWETVGETPYADDVFAPNFPQEKKTERAPSWNLTLQWQFNPTSQVYFTQRGSFRAGNFNGAVDPYNLANSFKNEYTHDFEVGYKYSGVVADRRTHFDIAAYDQVVRDAQHSIYAVVQGAPSAFTVNVPQATIKGAEADGDIEATQWLTIGFAGAYTNAVYTEDMVNLSGQTGVPGYVIPFDSYPDAPRWSGSFFADAKLPAPEAYGDMDLRVDLFTQSSSFFSNNNGSITPDTRLPGYTSVALRYGWNNIMQSRFSFDIYAKNLLDRVYYQAGYTEGASGGFNTVIPAEPRTIGAELTATF